MALAACAMLSADSAFAPLHPFLAIGGSAIVWLAAREFSALLLRSTPTVRPWFCQLGCLMILWSNWWRLLIPARDASDPANQSPSPSDPLIAFVVLAMLAFLLEAWKYDGPGKSVSTIAAHLFAFFYVGVLASFVVQTRWLGQTPGQGAACLLLTIFTAKVGDIGAYFIGKRFGKRRLAPKLSPGKTLEGSVGGLLSAVALAFAVVLVTESVTGRPWLRPLEALAFGLIVGMTAQLGDLMESLIKRDCEQKDSSTNIPGFGGVLDVVDSILFCGPVAFLLLRSQ